MTVGLEDEATCIAIVSRRQKKIESREEKDSVKVWDFDSNNSDVDRDF